MAPDIVMAISAIVIISRGLPSPALRVDGRAGQSYQRCRVIDETTFQMVAITVLLLNWESLEMTGYFTIGYFSGVDVMVNVYLSKSGMAVSKTALIIYDFKKLMTLKNGLF